MSTSGKSIGRSGVNYVVIRFDGKRDFGTQMKMEVVLKQQIFKIASASEKLKNIEADFLKDMEDETLTTIQSSLSYEVLRELSQKQTMQEL